MYLKERLTRLSVGRFVEIGPGKGEIAALLLARGWTGLLCEYEARTAEQLLIRFRDDVNAGRLEITNEDYLNAPIRSKADLVISSMVIEHLDDQSELRFMAKAATDLRPGGCMVGLVPASPNHWGIEDEIAGHYRRYTRSSLSKLLIRSGWKLRHVAGLTFPVSNWLLPLSNALVYRTERYKKGLSPLQRTKESGRRSVPFKTSFPPVLGFLLNERLLLPFHLLQKLCSRSEHALVLYFEAEPTIVGGEGLGW